MYGRARRASGSTASVLNALHPYSRTMDEYVLGSHG
jgi:hypothetical protein